MKDLLETMEKPKPCPFCGNSDFEIKMNSLPEINHKVCGMNADAANLNALLDYWNSRPIAGRIGYNRRLI